MTQYISGFRAAAGRLKLSQIDADYAVESFPRQADMVAGRDWLRPDNTSDVISQSDEWLETLSGKAFGYGQVTFTWRWRGLTPGMVSYLLTTFFNTNDYYGIMTLRTYNRASGEFEVYQATARRKLWPEAAEPALGSYDNFIVEFVDGIRMTAAVPLIASGTATSAGAASIAKIPVALTGSGTATSAGTALVAKVPTVLIAAGTATSAGTATVVIV